MISSCIRVVVVCKGKKQQQHFIHRPRKTLALCVINVSKRLITTGITIVSSEFLNRCLIVPSILRSKRRCKNGQNFFYPRSHSMLCRNDSYLWLLTVCLLPFWLSLSLSLPLWMRSNFAHIIICALAVFVMCHCVQCMERAQIKYKQLALCDTHTNAHTRTLHTRSVDACEWLNANHSSIIKHHGIVWVLARLCMIHLHHTSYIMMNDYIHINVRLCARVFIKSYRPDVYK